MHLQGKKNRQKQNRKGTMIRKHCTGKECQSLAVLGKKLWTYRPVFSI